MRGLIVGFLAVAFSFHLACSLQCYFCYEPTEIQNCTEIKTCSNDTSGCKTTALSPETGFPFDSREVLVTRDCAKTCKESEEDTLGQEKKVFCCQDDLCNNYYPRERNASHTTTTPNSSLSNREWRIHGGLILPVAIVSAVLLTEQ